MIINNQTSNNAKLMVISAFVLNNNRVNNSRALLIFSPEFK